MPTEDRRTEALTVAWMLSTMVTLGAWALAGLAWLVVRLLVVRPAEIGALVVVPQLLLAVALVTAPVALLLMACTLRLRRSQPPRSVVLVATAICLVPFGVLVLAAIG